MLRNSSTRVLLLSASHQLNASPPVSGTNCPLWEYAFFGWNPSLVATRCTEVFWQTGPRGPSRQFCARLLYWPKVILLKSEIPKSFTKTDSSVSCSKFFSQGLKTLQILCGRGGHAGTTSLAPFPFDSLSRPLALNFSFLLYSETYAPEQQCIQIDDWSCQKPSPSGLS